MEQEHNGHDQVEATEAVVEAVPLQEYRPAYYFPKPIEVPAEMELMMRGKIARKLADCYDLCGSLPERGYNEHFKYHYVLAEDLYKEARKAFHKVGLVIVPLLHQYCEEMIPAKYDSIKRKVVQPITFMVTDAETGYTLACPWHSEAMDNEDKGTGKALTSALKYFVKTLLMVPTGDDPDREGAVEEDASKKPGDAPKSKAPTPNPKPDAKPVTDKPEAQDPVPPKTLEPVGDDKPTVIMANRLGAKLAQAKAYTAKKGIDWPSALEGAFKDGVQNADEFRAWIDKLAPAVKAPVETEAKGE